MSILDLLSKAKNLLSRPKPTTNATDAVRHDTYDEALFQELLDEAPALRDLVEELNQDFGHTEDLVRDTVMQFWQGDPRVRSRAEMADSHLVNQAVAEDISRSEELRRARAYTVHDKYGAAMAAIGVSDEVRKYAGKNKEAMEAAEEAAEEAKQKQQEAEQALQEALAGLPGGSGGGGGDEEEGEGQPDFTDPDFHGPLSPAQQAAVDALSTAVMTAEEAQAKADAASQQAHEQAQQAQQALRRPVEEAVKEAADTLDEERELFGAWGVGEGQLQAMSFEERRNLAAALRSSRIGEFSDLVGRFRLMMAAQQVRKIEYGRDQVVGVELGGDLGRVVMSEYVALAAGDDDLAELLELDFYRRMHEDQLLVRKFEGAEKVGKGAIICLWDESGSMAGEREAWSKAFALALLEQARKQKRDFVGIGFSSRNQVVEYRFPKGRADISEVMPMIEHFFSGGTDFERPLGRATDILEREFNDSGRMRGDLVFITDDNCMVSHDWMRTFLERKKRLDFRIFGIAAGTSQPGGALESLSDNVRGIEDFTDPENVRDIFQVI